MHLTYDSLTREVHIHAFHLARLETAQRETLFAVLDGAEPERLGRLRIEERREEFLLAHGMLRVLLGQYLGADPAGLRFTAAAQGKPALAVPAAGDIEFNLAHARGRVVFAITRRRRVGVDVEFLDPRLPDAALFPALFTEDERQALADLPPELALRGFYTAWTRKEAFIKATGAGFSADLLAFSVTVDPRQAPQLTLHHGEAEWHLHNLDLSPDTAAALVVSGPLDYTIRRLSIP